MSKVSGLFKDLTTVKEARNGRLASWDQRGKNQDYWEIPAKESITLGEIEGPGCITHIWMTSSCRKVKAPSILDPVQNASAAPVMEIHPALGVIWDDYDPFYYRKALIKITWDDQETPSVLAPFGDFFCIGNCYPGNFSSLPFNVSLKPEEAGRYGAPCSVSCYFPMPFNKKAKIEIINENELPFILYFNIDYEMYKEPLDEKTAYFLTEDMIDPVSIEVFRHFLKTLHPPAVSVFFHDIPVVCGESPVLPVDREIIGRSTRLSVEIEVMGFCPGFHAVAADTNRNIPL